MGKVVLVFLAVVGCCSCGNPTNDSDNAIPDSSMGPAPTILNTVYKAVMSCAEREALVCLKKRAVFLLDRAATWDKLPIWGDAVVLVKSTSNVTSVEDSSDRSIGESFANFLDSRRVQLRLPRLSYFLPISEGRGKKNKGYGMIAMTIVGAMMAMGMAALAAMAGKALAASMAALMLALMAALRNNNNKGGGHGDHSSYEVISIPAPHHHHRSFADEQHLNSPYRYDADADGAVHHHER